MRSGRLLAEESPNNLMRNFRRPSLEDAFLKLCMDEQQTESMVNASISNATSIQNTEEAQQQQPQGDSVDYAEGVVNQTDVTETSVHRQRHSNSRGSIDSTTSSSVRKKFCLSKFYYN